MTDPLIIKLRFYQAIVDIVKIFGETEIGDCEVDEEAVANYINSLKFVDDMWGIASKEDIYKKLTDDIIDGFPVWEFLKISDWSKRMLECSFNNSVEQERKRLEKTYQCFTCKYLEESDTSLGIYRKCHRPKERFEMKRRDYFEPLRRCKSYVARDINE